MRRQWTTILVNTVRSIIDILKELQSINGLNVTYDIWEFDYNARKLDINNWDKQYSARGGGTNILSSFCTVQENLLNDKEVDGNKLIILITDGDVSKNEITELKKQIIKHGAETRCMVVGIGAEVTSSFVELIAGDNNILARENADAVIMDCIKTMLE